MPSTFIANLRGPIGPKGDTGDQGLPGVLAVDNDAAVAGYISAPGGSATQDAGDARYFGRTELWTNVKDFGAVGDGIADDTDALEAAFASTALNVYVPRGQYLVKRGLTIRSNRHVMGEGSSNAAQIIAAPDFDAVTYPAVVTLAEYAPSMSRILVRADGLTNVDCIRADCEWQPYIAHCRTIGGYAGVHILNGLESRMEHNAHNLASYAGVLVDDDDAYMNNIFTDKCGQGFRVNGGSAQVFHFHATESTTIGFYVNGGTGSQFVACTADTSGTIGFRVASGNEVRFTDCWAFKSGILDPGVWSSWLISDTSKTVIVGAVNTQETNLRASFKFTGVQSDVQIIASSASGEPTFVVDLASGATPAGVTFVNCVGALAKHNDSPTRARGSLVVPAGGSASLPLDLGFTPNLSSTAMVYKVVATSRASVEAKLVSCEFFHAEGSGTTIGSPVARAYRYGSAADVGGQFTTTFSRTGQVATVTVANPTAQTITIGLEIDALQPTILP